MRLLVRAGGPTARPAIVGDALKRAQEKRGSINWSPPKEAIDNTPQIDLSPGRPSRRSKERVSQKPPKLDLVKSVGDLASLTIDVSAASISLSPTGGRPKTKSECEKEESEVAKPALLPTDGQSKTKSECESEVPEAAKHHKAPTVPTQPATKPATSGNPAAAPAAVLLPAPMPLSDATASQNFVTKVDLSQVSQSKERSRSKKSGGQRRKEKKEKLRAEANAAEPTVTKKQPIAEGSKGPKASATSSAEKKNQQRASADVAKPKMGKNQSAAAGSKGQRTSTNPAAEKKQPQKVKESKLQTPHDNDKGRSNWGDKKWDQKWWMQGSIRGEQVRPFQFCGAHPSWLRRPSI